MRSRFFVHPLIPVTVVILAADLIGAIVAVQAGLADLRTVVVSGTAINAPGPFICVQVAVTAAAVRFCGRLGGTLAAGLLTILSLISVSSGFGDGSYGYPGLSAAEVAIQLAVVLPTLAAAAIAARQVAVAVRGRCLVTE